MKTKTNCMLMFFLLIFISGCLKAVRDEQQPHVVLPAPAADECRVSQGQVVSVKNRPILNARVSLLIPNVSAFEHTSIRDSSNVMAEVYSQKNGLFNLNKNLDGDFKYSILVEAGGKYAEKEIDLAKGCPKGSIKIIFR